MKRILKTLRLMTVISLSLGVIWLGPALAAGVPTFASLGQIKTEKLRVPGAMDLDGSGNLYVADARGGLVHKFNQYGTLLGSFKLQASGRGLAVTPDGSRLYVARNQAVVIADAVTGSVLGTLAGAESTGPEFASVGEIDLDAAGNVFVVDAGKMLVKIYSAAGQYRSQFGGIGVNNGQFQQIGGMAINPAGRVVVADASALNGKVQVFTLNTDLSVAGVVAYLKGAAANFGTPVMHTPRGFAFDTFGRGYFLEFFTSQIRVTSATFGYLGVYNKPGFAVGQLNNVTDAIFDTVNSRLFVGCDTGRIEILGVDGGQSPLNVNRAPTVPVPQSPVGGSAVDSATPTLTFGNASDPDGDALTYQVVVKRDAAVAYQTTVAGAAGGSTGVVVAGANLEENAAYTWTVQAFDAKTSSAVSAAAGFVINAVDDAPAAPQLLTPQNDARAAGADLLTWTESFDSDPNDYISGYQVEIAGDASFAEVLATQAATGNSLTLGSLDDYAQLQDGTSYFWRVTAFDRDQTPSEKSAAGRFVYDTTSLTVTANVPGARVFLGGNHAFAGRPVGVAPLELRDLPAGATSLVVTRPGFEPYVASLVIGERDKAVHAAVLVPATETASLSVAKNGINGKQGLAVDGKAAPFLADFNNDGTLDLLVGDATGKLSLFANLVVSGRNKLEFAPGVTLDIPVVSGAVPFVADWDNDGRKDLLIGSSAGTVTLFRNVGQEAAPAFVQVADLLNLSVASDAAPAVVDLNNDGLKDLLVGSGDGKVRVYYNSGSDAAPQLTEPVELFAVTGAAVPMPVDWDADGVMDIMVTAAGKTTVYALRAGGAYQAVAQLGAVSSGSFAAFPVDVDGGKGKEVIVGGQDGQLSLLAGNSKVYVASFAPALQAKIDEIGGFVAEVAPELLANVAQLSTLVAAGDFATVARQADALALMLPAGPAQNAALELAALCK